MDAMVVITDLASNFIHMPNSNSLLIVFSDFSLSFFFKKKVNTRSFLFQIKTGKGAFRQNSIYNQGCSSPANRDEGKA
jgi:hypothetical protein